MLMVRSEHWKLVHFGRDLPPQLFNLLDDPLELNDLGRDQGTGAPVLPQPAGSRSVSGERNTLNVR